MHEKQRVVCWFSCGIASAVATKEAITKYSNDENKEVVIAYCDTGSEHEDNHRFLMQCESWFGQKIRIIKSEKYGNIWDVFKKTKYLVGVAGARCTSELKKMVRMKFERTDDIQVFGYTTEEIARVNNFRKNNPEVILECPLVDKGFNKHDCFDYFSESNIRRPEMYRLGFNNNNCIPCVKGGSGYFSKIREVFPEEFRRMAEMERELNAAICKTYDKEGNRQRVFLDELPPNAGRHKALFEEDLFSHSMSCDFMCSSDDN